VKQYHPDVVKDMDKDEAEHRFITLQSAYELLMDAERRAEYDKEHRDHPLAANQAFQVGPAARLYHPPSRHQLTHLPSSHIPLSVVVSIHPAATHTG
jgi:curved DNA-binding protein CbpA